MGAVYGTITLGMGAGAACGSWISGLLYDLTGSYDAGLIFAMLSAVLAGALFWIIPALATGRHAGTGRLPVIG